MYITLRLRHRARELFKPGLYFSFLVLVSDIRFFIRLLDQFHQQQVRIRSFNDKDPSLEDVFMMITKGIVN